MNATTSWRDYADQLTAEQWSRLDAATHMSADDLLDLARDWIATNELQARMSHIAVPAGAVRVSVWSDDGERIGRDLYGSEHRVGNVVATLRGEQDGDGATTWQIEIDPAKHTLGDITAAQARELARVLLDAADALDRLDGTSPPFM